MGFGLNQIKNTTPQHIKNIRDTLLYFLMGSLAFAGIFAPKLHVTGEDYAMWIGFAMLAIKSIAKLFGVSDVEEVKQAMDVIDDRIEAARTDGKG